MEVEVKLRLPNSAAHQKLLSALSPFHVITHCQHNTFFDGASSELSSRRAILRLRFYNDDVKCIVSLKAKAVIENGVSRVEEDEEEINPIIGRDCVANPNKLKDVKSRIMKRVKEEFDLGNGGFVCLGGFRNVRGVHEWNGLKLEVDETMFDFGTCYEIECESLEPEKAKGLIEGFLKENGIEYSYSLVSKFAIFRSGKLPKLTTKNMAKKSLKLISFLLTMMYLAATIICGGLPPKASPPGQQPAAAVGSDVRRVLVTNGKWVCNANL